MFEVQMGADPITELSTGTPGTLRSISCGSKLFRARYGSFICEWSNCFAVLSCGVQSSCCCASVFVAKCDTWRAGAYNFNVSTRLHESQRHQASNGPLLLYRSSQSCRVGFRPNSELGFAIGRPSFEIPRSFMHQGPKDVPYLLPKRLGEKSVKLHPPALGEVLLRPSGFLTLLRDGFPAHVYVVLQREMPVFRKFGNRGIPISRYGNMKFHLPALGGRDRWSASCVPTRKSRGRSLSQKLPSLS